MSTRFLKHNVSIHGSGKQILIFLHGFGCNKSMWRFVAPAFYDSYTVVLLDLIGSGKSDIASYDFAKYDQLQGHSDDIIDLCHEQNWQDVILIGHSVSSMISILAAKKEPMLFKNLVLLGPSPCYINKENYFGGFNESDIHGLLDTMDANYLGWSSAITPVIMDNPDRPELTEELNNSFCRTDPSVAKHFGRVTFLSDNRSDLAFVHTPTLVIQSVVDSIAPVEVGKFVAQHMPNTTFTLIQAIGHLPHLSHPELTIHAIKNYLASFDMQNVN